MIIYAFKRINMQKYQTFIAYLYDFPTSYMTHFSPDKHGFIWVSSAKYVDILWILSPILPKIVDFSSSCLLNNL